MVQEKENAMSSQSQEIASVSRFLVPRPTVRSSHRSRLQGKARGTKNLI
jgi:hypothetical protein